MYVEGGERDKHAVISAQTFIVFRGTTRVLFATLPAQPQQSLHSVFHLRIHRCHSLGLSQTVKCFMNVAKHIIRTLHSPHYIRFRHKISPCIARFLTGLFYDINNCIHSLFAIGCSRQLARRLDEAAACFLPRACGIRR